MSPLDVTKTPLPTSLCTCWTVFTCSFLLTTSTSWVLQVPWWLTWRGGGWSQSIMWLKGKPQKRNTGRGQGKVAHVFLWFWGWSRRRVWLEDLPQRGQVNRKWGWFYSSPLERLSLVQWSAGTRIQRTEQCWRTSQSRRERRRWGECLRSSYSPSCTCDKCVYLCVRTGGPGVFRCVH